MIVLIANSVIYWSTAFYFYRKDGLTIFSFLWFYYAVFSVFGVLLMKDDLYFVIEGISTDNEMHIIPYVYLYFSFLLITTPLKHIRRDSFSLSNNSFYNKETIQLCNILLKVSYIYLAVKFLQFYYVFQIGFGMMHELEGDDIIYPGAIGWFLRILNIIGRFVMVVLMPIVVFYTASGFIKGYICKRIFIRTIIVFCIGTLIVGIIGGSRGSMFFGLMSLTYYLLFFWGNIPSKYKHSFIIVAIALSIILYFIVIEITEYRFGDHLSVGDSILSYLGQVWPNANYRIWEQPTSHPMGKRFFPFIFGTSNLDSDYWYYHSNISGWLFHSIWGSFYTEFGEYLGFLFIILISLLFRLYLKKRKYHIYEVGIVFYFYYFCFTSLFNLAFSYMDYLGWLLSFGTAFFIRNSKLKRLFT